MSQSKFLEIITLNEMKPLRDTFKDGVQHPLVGLDLSDQVKANTEKAASRIAQQDFSWIQKIKPRLLDTTDFANSSSALGEIRAYGALLETGISVDANAVVGNRHPEFEVDAGDGKVIVEVHSRQLDPKQIQAIKEQKEQHKTSVEAAKERKANPDEIVSVYGPCIAVMPFGTPEKMGDSVLTNAISRIAAIKAGEKQSDPEKPFVLWLDFQDLTVFGLSIPLEQLAPLYSKGQSGDVGAGALWYALYGRKCDPMIQMQSLDYGTILMLHDGKFEQSKKVSAVVYSMPRTTILMEHPSPTHRIPPSFRASLLKLPFSDLNLSICEWEPGLVQSRLDLERKVVEATVKALSQFNLIVNSE